MESESENVCLTQIKQFALPSGKNNFNQQVWQYFYKK